VGKAPRGLNGLDAAKFDAVIFSASGVARQRRDPTDHEEHIRTARPQGISEAQVREQVRGMVKSPQTYRFRLIAILRGDEHVWWQNPTVEPADTSDVSHTPLSPSNLPTYLLDRLSRYEASLWRLACQVLFTLQCLDRRKPWERLSVSPEGGRCADTPWLDLLLSVPSTIRLRLT
jgi:hypothetical protein